MRVAKTILLLSIIWSTNALAQTGGFEKVVRGLFFGVDIKMVSALDSFMKVTDLHHQDDVLCQSSLSISTELQSDTNALACRHLFLFTQSPVPKFRIDTGYIEVNMGQAPGVRKILDISWQVQFATQKEGMAYFEKIKSLFGPVSTYRHYLFDKTEKWYIAMYATRNPAEKAMPGITLMFGQPAKGKKYEVRMLITNGINSSP